MVCVLFTLLLTLPYVMSDQANLAELILYVPRKLYSWLEWVTEERNGKKKKPLQLLYTKGININQNTFSLFSTKRVLFDDLCACQWIFRLLDRSGNFKET